MKKQTILILLSISMFLPVLSQKPVKKDKGEFVEQKDGYYQNHILKEIEAFKNPVKTEKPRTKFSVDLSGYDLPDSPDKFKKTWFNAPVNQGKTGTCWCFASTSFLESEVYRIHDKKIKLSEMYIVYQEYIERARAFVRERGNVYFEQGSEANAVTRMMKMHGAMPESAYTGRLRGQSVFDHSDMIREMKKYLSSVKESGAWNEDEVVNTIKSIMNHYMGTPPETFTVEGKAMTPKEYLNEVLKLRINDYFSFMSTMEMPYNQKGELVERDNWWHSKDYYNVSLEDYMHIITNAIENSYSISLCGDVSEPGHDKYAEVSIIPTFDIPSEYIDESARQLRLTNKATTDDHCIHLVGYLKKGDDLWFLIKDSGSGAQDGPNKGYRFFHEDYVKLKMMNVLVHKEAASDVLDEIIK